MIDHLTLFRHISWRRRAGDRLSLAVVIRRSGSSPCSLGAMLVMDGEASHRGTIGGGRLEYEVLEDLRRMRDGGPARLREVRQPEETNGHHCGGDAGLLLTPLHDEAIEVFEAAVAALEQDRACTLHVALGEHGTVSWGLAPLPDAAGSAWSIPLHAAARLLVFGAGHIARALISMAREAEFAITVVDDRPAYLAIHPLPEDIEVRLCEDFSKALPGPLPDAATFVLIATHGHEQDRMVLEQILATEAGYIGMVGSRRKREEIFGQLAEAGFTAAALARVSCPAGLAIGARTPAEIAVSILAEMITHRRLGCAPASAPLRERPAAPAVLRQNAPPPG